MHNVKFGAYTSSYSVHRTVKRNISRQKLYYLTQHRHDFSLKYLVMFIIFLKLVVCILLRVLGQVQGFRLTQHWFEYFI
jgi:hypothetical protein